VWTTNRMIYYDEFLNDREARIEAWRQKFLIWPEMRDAQPNAGHLALLTWNGAASYWR
jgi:NAD-dependent deacetylase